MAASDGVLELTHTATQRATDLRKALGAEHQQQNHDYEGDVGWIIESHYFKSTPLWDVRIIF